MEPIEEKLKQAMNRVNPPDGFVARVMARVEAQPPVVSKLRKLPYSPWLAWWKHLTVRPVPAGAVVLTILVSLGAGLGHWRGQALSPRSAHERMEGEKARDQMMLALEITGAHLARMHELLSQPPPNGPRSGDKSGPPGFSH